MLNQIYMNNQQFTNLINAINNGGGGGGGVNYINIPQTDFTYIPSNNSFSVDLTNYNITKTDILAIGVYSESGASVWGCNITSNNELEVTGWCPFLSTAIDNTWSFTCNILTLT